MIYRLNKKEIEKAVLNYVKSRISGAKKDEEYDVKISDSANEYAPVDVAAFVREIETSVVDEPGVRKLIPKDENNRVDAI